MQIILLEKVGNLGQLGEVVQVKDGYARNYLIPHGKARRATKDAIAEFESRRAELEKAQNDRLAIAQTAGSKLNGSTVTLMEKAGVDGRLFGSVSNITVADALKSQGHEVDRAMVRMPDGPIKAVGEFEVTVALHTDVIAEVKVVVEAEAD